MKITDAERETIRVFKRHLAIMWLVVAVASPIPLFTFRTSLGNRLGTVALLFVFGALIAWVTAEHVVARARRWAEILDPNEATRHDVPEPGPEPAPERREAWVVRVLRWWSGGVGWVLAFPVTVFGLKYLVFDRGLAKDWSGDSRLILMVVSFVVVALTPQLILGMLERKAKASTGEVRISTSYAFVLGVAALSATLGFAAGTWWQSGRNSYETKVLSYPQGDCLVRVDSHGSVQLLTQTPLCRSRTGL